VTNLPAYLLNRQPRGLAEAVISGLNTGAPPYVSIRGSRFKLVDAAGNEQPVQALHLDVVIVDANQHVSKVFYKDAYDPNATEYKPPTCFSDNGIGPSRQSVLPQHATCQACPHNQWGSDISKVSGKQTKACNDVKKLAVMVPGNRVVFLLRVPPASLKNLGAYVKSLAGQSVGDRPVDVADVVTRLSFDPDAVGILKFEPVSWIDEPTAAAMSDIWAKKLTDDLVGRKDTPIDAMPAQPTPQQIAPPPSAPPPVPPAAAVASPAPQESPAPARRRGRPPKEETQQVNQMPPQQMQFGASQMPADDGLDIPPFLKRDAPPPAPKASAPTPAQFGMQQPAAPNPELMAMLEGAMSLPTKD
jgi:hypothetical protein